VDDFAPERKERGEARRLRFRTAMRGILLEEESAGAGRLSKIG
jgi:hypothetical protein